MTEFSINKPNSSPVSDRGAPLGNMPQKASRNRLLLVGLAVLCEVVNLNPVLVQAAIAALAVLAADCWTKILATMGAK